MNEDPIMLFEASNVPSRHRKVKPDFNTPWGTMFSTVSESLESNSSVIIAIGDRGRGKTQMGVELVRKFCRDGKTAYFTTALRFFMDMQDAFRTDERNDTIDFFIKPRLLVIDEAHERSNSDWEDRMLAMVVNERYQELRSTLVIANYSEEEVEKHLNPSILSRAEESGGIVVFDWESFRSR